MEKEVRQNKVVKIFKEEYKRFLIISLSSVIYALGLMWFLQPGGLYSGGVVGLMQLVINIIAKVTGETYSIGVFIFLVNAPILVFAFKYVSLRFALYSLLSITIQSVLGIDGLFPFIDLGVNVATNPAYNQLLLGIIGGALVGVGGALALRYGGSTGGLDVFAQYLALKKDLSIGNFSLVFNGLVALSGGIVLRSWPIFLYTVIRICVTSAVTDKIHTVYNHLKVEIITDFGDEISKMIMTETGRGVTIINGEGAYTHKRKYVLEVVVSSFELVAITESSKAIDKHVFIISSPVKSIVGNFKKRTIA